MLPKTIRKLSDWVIMVPAVKIINPADGSPVVVRAYNADAVETALR
ncbi:MAG: hypothetical protein M3R24_04730 [Chloroflexota bacterium]|nr:hypothetical protein [Chloroflexota bacterium]